MWIVKGHGLFLDVDLYLCSVTLLLFGASPLQSRAERFARKADAEAFADKCRSEGRRNVRVVRLVPRKGGAS